MTVLLAHDPLSSLAYPTITHTPVVAGNLPIKTLVARRWPISHDTDYDTGTHDTCHGTSDTCHDTFHDTHA